MKINEKHLCAYAVSSAPTSKEGYLLKRGDLNRAFQKRWFVLKGNLLFYFEDRSSRDLIGVIILHGCIVQVAESEDAYAFELVFEGHGTRTYILAADTQEEMEEWMRTLTCANYDYLKDTVAQLQHQLDELNAKRFQSALQTTPSLATAATPSVPQSSEGLLIDIGGPSLPPPRVPPSSLNPQSRFNPFNDNMMTNVGTGFDKTFTSDKRNPFDESSFSAEDISFQDAFSARKSCPPELPDFDTLHREYGIYIQQKIREYSRSVPN